MKQETLLTVSGINFSIGAHNILNDVNFTIAKGEVVGLIGPNGSGKTTLFNVLSGFSKPSSGTVTYEDIDITTLSPPKRAKLGFGRVFQNFGIFRDMTLEENILVALEAMPKAERKQLGDLKKVVKETLKLATLEKFAKKKAGSLSGGQMRLLEIARTLQSGKQFFLLDEPTAGVSPKMTHQVADMIKLLKEQGKTIIIIEHDLPFISKICDNVLVVDVGSVVLQGKPEEIQHSKKLKEIYFGADPTE